MNVEIGAEAALFPEKEYTVLPLQCGYVGGDGKDGGVGGLAGGDRS